MSYNSKKIIKSLGQAPDEMPLFDTIPEIPFSSLNMIESILADKIKNGKINKNVAKFLSHNGYLSSEISRNLKFHIEKQDYFGTLATVLSLCRQENQPIPEHIIDDLIHLQKNYKITNI